MRIVRNALSLALLLVLLVVSAVFGVRGVDELRLLARSGDEPQSLTLAELVERGPGENVRVHVRDAVVVRWGYVFGMVRGEWTDALVSAVPRDSDAGRALAEADFANGELPPAGPVVLLFKLADAHGDQAVGELAWRADNEGVPGMVINDVTSLGRYERMFLADEHPELDVDELLIVEVDREPAGALELTRLFGLSALALAAAFAWWRVGRRRRAAALSGA